MLHSSSRSFARPCIGYATRTKFRPPAFDVTVCRTHVLHLHLGESARRLAEVSSANNTSVRRIVLKGSPASHVDVLAYEDVDSA